MLRELSTIPSPVKGDLARFLSKVRVNSETGCHEWRTGKTYARFKIGVASLGAHRVAYAWLIGPIPAGRFVCHRCDNPRCVNPEHLFAGTNSENIVDAVSKGRIVNSAKAACPHGHAYSAENTYRRTMRNGRFARECRTCKATRH